jgi:hypothetical protein
MKQVLIMAVAMWMTGDAYAADLNTLTFADLKVRFAEENITAPAVTVAAKEVAEASAPQAADPLKADNVQKLMLYISARSTNGNDFDEERALRTLFSAQKISDVQTRVLKTIFDYARYENDFRLFTMSS